MISKKMQPFLKNNSAIRMMFEEGTRLKALYGADHVFDFSLGNPNVPAPEEIREAILDILDQEDPTALDVGEKALDDAIAETDHQKQVQKQSVCLYRWTVPEIIGQNTQCRILYRQIHPDSLRD